MANNVILPKYQIGENDVYLNGRKLNDQSPLALTVAGQGVEKYNIDFLLQVGSKVNIANASVTAVTSGVNIITTDVASKYDVPLKGNMEIGRIKLIQLVKVKQTDAIEFKIVIAGKTYTVKLTIEPLDKAMILIPNLKTVGNESFFSNGVSEYPASNFDLPVPLAFDSFNVSWLDNNKAYELGTDAKINANLFFDTNIISIANIKDGVDQQTTDMNNLQLNFKSEFTELNNVNKDDFLIPFVVEFTKDDKVISSRSITFAKMRLYIKDIWDNKLETLYLPANDSETTKKNYRFVSNTPNLEILETPYLRFLNTNGVTGIMNLAKNRITFNNLGYTEANKRLDVVCKRTPNENTFTLEVNYTKIDELSVGGGQLGGTTTPGTGDTGTGGTTEENTANNSFILGLSIGNLSVGSSWQMVQLLNETTATSVTITKDQEQLTIFRYESTELQYTANNIATFVFEDIDKKGTPPKVTYASNIEYYKKVPNGNLKVYPQLSGAITIDCKDASPGEHKIRVKAVDSDKKELYKEDLTVTVKRPRAQMECDLSTKKYNVNIDKPKAITVKCKNVFRAEVANKDNLTKFTATIQNIKNSKDLLETGTYATYDFDILFTGKATGVENLAITLYDDKDDVTMTVKKPIEVFTTNYVSVKADPNPADIKDGLAVRHSYKEKYRHNLPTAFIANGEEADYILVCKYPISQDTFTETVGDKTNVLISKPNAHRLEYVEASKVGDGEATEGGELFKVANPDISKPILKSIKENNMLNGYAYAVGDSIYLDTMLANLNDAHYLACLENMESDRSVNWLFFNRTSNFYGDQEARAYYPELPLKSTGNTKGGVWTLGGKVGDTEEVYGVVNPKIADLMTYTNHTMLPRTLAGTHFTHNGQKNGVAEPFGFGVKTYSDIRYSWDGKVEKLEVINPYTTIPYYTNDDPKTFTEIKFNDDMFMLSTPKAYIGCNDYKANSKSSIFYNAEYYRDSSAYLLDNAGLPMNNIVKEYEDDDSFKGDAGYRKDKAMTRFGGSVYRFDSEKISKNRTIATKGYIVSGYSLDGSLVKLHTDVVNKNPEHISLKYPEYTDGSITGSYRSRMLIDENTVYNINKVEGKKNDQIYYNSRIHFLIFDTLTRQELANLSVSEKYVEVEKGKEFPMTIVSEGGTIEFEGINDKIATITTKSILAVEEGTTEVTIRAKQANKKDNTFKVYIKVTPQLQPTSLVLQTNSLTTRVGDVYIRNATTEADTVTVTVDDETLVNVTVKPKTGNNVPLVITATDAGNANITVSAIKQGKSMSHDTITVEIKENLVTEFSFDPKELQVTRDEAVNMYNNMTISSTIKPKTNIDGTGMIYYYSSALKGKRIRVNSDYSFDVDMGSPTPGDYVVNYIAQIDGGFPEQSSGTLKAEKPTINAANKRKIVEGTFTIKIV